MSQKVSLKEILSSGQQASNIDYSIYRLSIKEFILYGLESFGIVGLIAYVFYRSAVAFILLSPLSILYMQQKRKELRDKRYLTLGLQFRELMNSMIASLQAGYSIENSFVHSHSDMSLLFGKNSYISLETAIIIKGMRNNGNVEDLLMDFGIRSHEDDIKDFAEMFRIAKRSGGDLPKMIKQTADIISEKMDVRRRIATIISAKKMEQSVMNLVPFGIILYIDFSSPGFFDALYHNIAGIVIMTMLLGIYLVAYMMAKKITDIKV